MAALAAGLVVSALGCAATVAPTGVRVGQADASFPDSFEAHFIQLPTRGDAILLRVPPAPGQARGYDVLIDTGRCEAGPAVSDYLAKLGVRTLDLVVITHNHPDHVGGLARIVRDFLVRQVWHSRWSQLTPDERAALVGQSNESAIRFVPVDVDHPLQSYGDARFAVLWPRARPAADEVSRGPNDNSVVLKVCYGDCDSPERTHKTEFLVTGDISDWAEAKLIADGDEPSRSLTSTVLKVPHHGSDTSTSVPFVEAVAPALAVVFVNDKLLSGDGLASTMRTLRRIPTYRTNVDGTVIITTSGPVRSMQLRRLRARHYRPPRDVRSRWRSYRCH